MRVVIRRPKWSSLTGHKWSTLGGHQGQRVAMDTFSKIPAMIAPTIRDRLARGETINSVAMLPALFLAYLQRWHAGQIPYTYQDQAMDPAAAQAICEAADPVAAYCANAVLWGPLASDERLVQALRQAFTRVNLFIKNHRRRPTQVVM